MIVKDDRTAEQRDTHRWLVVGTDSFMSGWGQAASGNSYAAWACETLAEAKAVQRWVSARSEMKRVRLVLDGASSPYRPDSRYCAHLHIYLWTDRS
jgi:hypothetical protein